MSGIYLFCLVLALHCRDLGLEGVGVLDGLVVELLQLSELAPQLLGRDGALDVLLEEVLQDDPGLGHRADALEPHLGTAGSPGGRDVVAAVGVAVLRLCDLLLQGLDLRVPELEVRVEVFHGLAHVGHLLLARRLPHLALVVVQLLGQRLPVSDELASGRGRLLHRHDHVHLLCDPIPQPLARAGLFGQFSSYVRKMND